MLFSSVFNSMKSAADKDDTSNIMNLQNGYNDSHLDNDENRFLLDTPRNSNKSLNFNSGYLDDGNYYSSGYSRGYNEDNFDEQNEVYLDDTLQKIKKDYEKSKQKLQNNELKSKQNSSFKSIFGNGLSMPDEADSYNDRLSRLRLKDNRSTNDYRTKIPGSFGEHNSLRDDSLYNIKDVKPVSEYRYRVNDEPYTPLKQGRTRRELDFDSNNVNNVFNKDKLKHNRSYNEMRDMKYENSETNNFYNNLKLQMERERYNDKLNDYKDSINQQHLQLQRQNDIISDLEHKYISLCSMVGEQKKEVSKLKDGLANEREISLRLNNRVEVLSERLTDTKSLLYKTQLQTEKNSFNRVRFDEPESYLSKKNNNLNSPLATPPLSKVASHGSDENEDFDFGSYGFDMDNTQHVLKLANKYQS